MRLSLESFHLITHAGCMDGSTAAILFMHAGGLKKNIRYVGPAFVDETIAESSVFKNPSNQILFVDVCPASDDAIDYLEQRGNFTVIDHHSTAAKFAGKAGFHIDVRNDACGSENFRQWLVKGGMPQFDEFHYRRMCQIVDDHDRWQLKEPMAIQAPVLFSMIGQQEFVDRFFDVKARFSEQKDFYWTPFEAEMLLLLQKAQQRRFNRLMDKFVVKMFEFDGQFIKIAYLVSGEVNCSELLNTYLQQHPDVDIACQINLDYNRLSLRSNGGVDVAKFASHFGGGGHPTSSGHPMPEGLTDQIIKVIHG